MNFSDGQQFSAVPQIPWTTARCNRLLRPLQSRISILRRTSNQGAGNVDRVTQAKSSPDSQSCTAFAMQSLRSIKQPARQSVQRHGRHDPEWVPAATSKRRRVKYKYSGPTTADCAPLGRAYCFSTANPGAAGAATPGQTLSAISVSTPLLTRIRDCNNEGTYLDLASTDTASVTLDPQSQTAHKPQVRAALRDALPITISLDQPRAIIQKLKKDVSPSHWTLVDGLYNGLEALLNATSVPGQAQKVQRGARSLFSTCLVSIPDYIAEEQQWQRQQDMDDQTDVSSEIYSDLESLGNLQAHGWEPLREVVRAHGVAILGDAIKENLIGYEVVRALILLCVQKAAADEGEVLLSSLISGEREYPKPFAMKSRLFSPNISVCMSILKDYVERTGRRSFQYRQLEVLLRSRCLPVEWLATRDFVPFWSRLVQSILQVDKDTASATSLFQTAVIVSVNGTESWSPKLTQHFRLNTERFGEEQCPPKLMRQSLAGFAHDQWCSSSLTEPSAKVMVDGLSNTMANLLVILVATVLIRQDEFNKSKTVTTEASRPVLQLIERLAINIQETVELRCMFAANYEMLGSINPRLMIILLSHELSAGAPFGLLKEACSLRATKTISLLSALGPRNAGFDVINRMSEFICAVVCCFGRASKDNGFYIVQKIVQHLTSLPDHRAESHSSVEGYLMGRTILEVAFLFAESTGCSEHFAFAEGVQRSASMQRIGFQRSPPREPQAANYKSTGFRWEEGICEWVAATPALAAKERAIGVPASTHLYEYRCGFPGWRLTKPEIHQSTREQHVRPYYFDSDEDELSMVAVDAQLPFGSKIAVLREVTNLPCKIVRQDEKEASLRQRHPSSNLRLRKKTNKFSKRKRVYNEIGSASEDELSAF
ncbi:MAG: hypothetical protein M1827_006804 [Pycnora praestabilis]|nr:MAG: hypothetical protein M1827_006804 [Pycnora praestabilis]